MAELNIDISLNDYINKLKQLKSEAVSTSSSVSALSSANSDLSSEAAKATNSVTAQAAELANLRAQFQSASSAIEQSQISARMSAATQSISQLASTTSGSLIPAFTQATGSLSGTCAQMSGLTAIIPGLSSVMGVLTGANTAATASFVALNTASGGILLAIGVAITAIVAIINEFKKGLERNAEAQGTWSRALSTLKPIIDAVHQAIDFVVTAVANLFDKVMSVVPSIVKIFTGAVTTLARYVYKPVLVAFGKIYGSAAIMASKVARVIGDLCQKILKVTANTIRKLPFFGPEVADKIDAFADTCADGINKFADKMEEAGTAMRDKTGEAVDAALDKMAEFGNGLADNMEAERKYTDAKRQFTKEQRELDELSAKTAKETDELKQKVNMAATKKEKAELLKQAIQLNENLKKRKEMLAKSVLDEYQLALKRQKLVSAAERQKEADLKKAYAEAGKEETTRLTELKSMLKSVLQTASASSGRTATRVKSDRDDSAQKQIDAINSLKEAVVSGFEAVTNKADTYIKDFNDYVKILETVSGFPGKLGNIVEPFKTELMYRLGELSDDIIGKRGKTEVKTSASAYFSDGYFDVKSFLSFMKNWIKNATVADNLDKNEYTQNVLSDVKYRKFEAAFWEAFNESLRSSMNIAWGNVTRDILHDIDILNARGDDSAGRLGVILARFSGTTEDIHELLASLLQSYKTRKIDLGVFDDSTKKTIITAAEKAGYGNNIRSLSEQQLLDIGVISNSEQFSKLVSDSLYKLVLQLEEYTLSVKDKTDEIKKTATENRVAEIESATNKKAAEFNVGITDKTLERVKELSALYAAGSINAEQLSKNMNELNEQNETDRLNQEVEAARTAWENYRAYLEEFATLNPQADITDKEIELMQLEVEYKQKQTEKLEAENRKQVAADAAAAEKKKKNQERWLKYSEQAAGAVVSLGNTYVELQQTKIKSELEAGKISEAEAQNQFERTKKVSVAMAVINTLATIPAQMYSIWSDASITSYWAKAALTVATIAPTTAALVAQINQIKATTLDSSGAVGSSSSVSAGTASAASAPLLDENQDIDRVQAIQGAQDQQVYILEKDIQDSNRRVSVREKNSTF